MELNKIQYNKQTEQNICVKKKKKKKLFPSHAFYQIYMSD